MSSPDPFPIVLFDVQVPQQREDCSKYVEEDNWKGKMVVGTELLCTSLYKALRANAQK